MSRVNPETLFQIGRSTDPAHYPSEFSSTRIWTQPIDHLGRDRNDVSESVHLQLPIEGILEMKFIEGGPW